MPQRETSSDLLRLLLSSESEEESVCLRRSDLSVVKGCVANTVLITLTATGVAPVSAPSMSVAVP